MMRRRIAAGIGVVAVILIVVLVNGCLKSQRTAALKSYNENVNIISKESEQQVARPFFSTLAGAPGQSAISVSTHVNELRQQAMELTRRAEGLSVPGDMAAAQRNLLLALKFRSEGLLKIANLIRGELGAQAQQASTKIAGDMEIFLASNVVYSQRVVPLIEQTLTANGVSSQSTSSSRFLPNLGWLEPNTVISRITGQSGSQTKNGELAPGTHGSSLGKVSVGSTELAPQPSLNHVSGGANPTFTIGVLNSGENVETSVKVDVEVEGGEKKVKASRTIDKTTPGETATVNIPVQGVAIGDTSRVTVNIQAVPGETDLENNKGVFLAVFEG